MCRVVVRSKRWDVVARLVPDIARSRESQEEPVETVGIIALVVVAILFLLMLILLIRSLGDIARYLRVRKM